MAYEVDLQSGSWMPIDSIATDIIELNDLRIKVYPAETEYVRTEVFPLANAVYADPAPPMLEHPLQRVIITSTDDFETTEASFDAGEDLTSLFLFNSSYGEQWFGIEQFLAGSDKIEMLYGKMDLRFDPDVELGQASRHQFTIIMQFEDDQEVSTTTPILNLE